MFSKKVNLTAYQHWTFPGKVFPNNGGKDGFRGFCVEQKVAENWASYCNSEQQSEFSYGGVKTHLAKMYPSQRSYQEKLNRHLHLAKNI